MSSISESELKKFMASQKAQHGLNTGPAQSLSQAFAEDIAQSCPQRVSLRRLTPRQGRWEAA